MNQNQSENLDGLEKFLVNRPAAPSSSSGNRELDYDRFYDACDSLKPLKMNDEDSKYYTDFASVRGGKIIDRIKKDVKTLQRSGNDSSYQFFTGHIGGGKSTELNRLTGELLEEGFHVVYFMSDEYLDTHNVDIPDILLAIARQVVENLEEIDIRLFPGYFRRLLGEIAGLLTTPLELDSVNLSLGVELAKISAEIKTSPKSRNQLRTFLDSRTASLIESLNDEILKPAIEKLKQKGKKGLVVIVDNLERIANQIIPNYNCTQPEYIFINRGSVLTEIKCHLVYTVPLSLLFSAQAAILLQRIGKSTSILPMILVEEREGTVHEQGLKLLKQMVMARAFPDVSPEEHLEPDLITQVFQDETVLNRLCQISGGHVRTLLLVLQSCLLEDDLPILPNILERVIREYRDNILVGISSNNWEVLRKVDREKQLSSDVENYQEFLRRLWVFEYRDDQGRWFGVNPMLKETEQFKKESSRLG